MGLDGYLALAINISCLRHSGADAFLLDYLSGAADLLVYFRIARVSHTAGSRNSDIQFVGSINVDAGRAGYVDISVTGAQIVRIDFAGAGRTNLQRLALAGSDHGRGARRLNFELVVFQV